MSKSIFLDRDGVINHDAPTGIHTAALWQAIPGSLEAIASLNRAGWQVFVVTNQSGIARGYYDLLALSDIHEKMMRELAEVGGYIQEIFFCPHSPEAACTCRKPKPGLIFQCQAKYDLILEEVFFIGDKLSDIEAAKAAGCHPVLVKTGQGSDVLKQFPDLKVPVFADLREAVTMILQQE